MMPRINLLYLTISTIVFACKPEQQVDRRLSEKAQAEMLTLERYASSVSEVSSRANFYYSVFKKPFEKRYDELIKVTVGSVEPAKVPYSGYWYQESTGGTNVGNPSALKKYDDVFNGGQPKAVNWEIQNHNAKDELARGNESWTGHCNGFAASAQRHKEPENPVTENGVTFTPRDIKTLLAEIYMSAKSVFLGGRRCKDQGTNYERPEPTEMGSCLDVNPGTFFLSLANWIGRARHTVIADYDAGYQVWNYPLYRYDILQNSSKGYSPQQELTKDQALQLIKGNAGGPYEFNPDAVSFRYLEMITYQANALPKLEAPDMRPPTHVVFKQTHAFVLELNAEKDVIGGEWVGASKTKHPDFIWVALEPGSTDGSRRFGNPNVDPKTVIKLWAKSIGANPEDPPLDIIEPILQSDWGKFNDFEITVDGNDRGSVFMGKKARLIIKRHPNFYGEVSLAINLNEKDLGTVAGKDQQDMLFDLDPVVGINRLKFNWTKSSQKLPSEFVWFVAIK